ncbi:MAG: hypothetical protein LIP11_08975 [Clostridiales bacterium]|nr:hypothetical protein [Clostridiales bacterium]
MNQNDVVSMASEMVASLVNMTDEAFAESKAMIMAGSEDRPRVRAIMEIVIETAEWQRGKEVAV